MAMTAMPTACLALAALALPLAAQAEGARLVFDCVDEQGVMEIFMVAPAETDAAGRGPITVTYAGVDYAGLASSHKGPFQFGTDTDHFALLFHNPTSDGRLAVQLHHATAHTSTLTNYICETND